ncbi:Fras1 [Symbiodinium sp. CCMP2592]|nr:Fras1 [Symbiodinium sp. CCMP2592]
MLQRSVCQYWPLWLALLHAATAASYCSSSDSGSCIGQLQSLKWNYPREDPVFAGLLPNYSNLVRAPYLCDLDLDGLVDRLDVNQSGSIVFSRRIAKHALAQPIVLADVGAVVDTDVTRYVSQLQAVDWDADGDLDLFVFNADGQGKALYLEQVPAPNPSNWSFVLRMGTANPLRSVRSQGQVQVIDWDLDGDLDVLFAEGPWSIRAPNLDDLAYKDEPEFGFLENMAGELVARVGKDNPLNGLSSPARVLAVHAVDWDSDGDVDLLFWEFSGWKNYGAYSCGLAYYENSASGSFTRKERLLEDEMVNGPTSLQAIDWDMDGLLDLRVGPFMLKRSVRGTIAERPAQLNPLASLGLSFHGLAFVDWDGDGLVDVLDAGNGVLRFFQARQGESALPSPESFPQVQIDDNTVIAAGDWDGDGDADLLARDANGTLRYYQRLDASSIGSLAATTEDDNPFQHVNDTEVRQLQMADWNGDGRTDLLLLRRKRYWHEVVLWEQLEGGGLVRREAVVSSDFGNRRGCHFSRSSNYDWDEAQAFSVVDYNRDGRLDFIGKRRHQYSRSPPGSGTGEVFLCERTPSGTLGDRTQLFSYESFRYQNFIHVTPWDTSQTLNFVLDSDMWTPSFCVREGACSGSGACAPHGCHCATEHHGSADCSLCTPGYYAASRAFGFGIDCLRCAGDQRICAARGFCNDDQAEGRKARDAGSNATAVLKQGNGSCTCSDAHFRGTDSAGRTTCMLGSCPAGMQLVANADTMVHTCEACPKGTASANGDPCQQCTPGRAAEQQSSMCLPCEAGRFVASFAAAVCLPCPPGSFSDSGQPSCVACSAGSVAGPASSQCAPCKPGRYAGTATECSPCPAGTTSSEGQTSCIACMPGRAVLPNATKCTPCQAGYFRNGTKTECSACLPGFSSDEGQAKCTACPAGFVAGSASSQCNPCEAGRFAAASGADCLQCAPGTFSNAGQAKCAACPAGLVAGSAGSQCKPCEAGRFAAASRAECLPCAAGTFSSAGQSECTTCAVGFVAGPESSQCHRCAHTLVVMTSDGSRQDCHADLNSLVFLLLFMASVSVCVHLGLKSLSFYALAISDVSTNKGGSVVLTTHHPHRVLRWSWSRPAVQLRGTGVPDLDAGAFRFSAKASDSKHLILSVCDPEHASRLGSLTTSSMGTLVLGSLNFWLYAGLLGVPFSLWLLPLSALAVWSASKVQPAMAGVVTMSAVLIFMALRLLKQLASHTPIAQARRRFAQQLLASRVPKPCERGSWRAMRIELLLEFYEFFKAFIQDRSMYYICSNLVIPLTEPDKLSYAELVGPSETAWFISHYWGMGLRHFVEAIVCHSKTKEASEAVASYWICTFSNNQWQVVEELGSGDWQESSFFKALRGPSCRGTVMIIDEAALPLQRAWCLFEVLQTNLRSTEDSSFLGFRLCTSTGVLNEGGVGTDLCMTIAGKLAALDLRNAQASNPHDLQMIQSLVYAMPGGYDAMNAFVRASIREALLSVKTRFEEDFKKMLDRL